MNLDRQGNVVKKRVCDEKDLFIFLNKSKMEGVERKIWIEVGYKLIRYGGSYGRNGIKRYFGCAIYLFENFWYCTFN